MDSALGWIGAIVEWFGRFLPRWVVVDTTHAWIKWVGGRFVWKRWRPGWDATLQVVTGGPSIVCWWPAVTEIKIYPVARQALDLRAQVVTLRDGKPVMVGGLITYRIFDITKALGNTWDIDETVRDTSLSAIHAVISRMESWDAIRTAEADGSLAKMLRTEARRVLETYGVRAIKLSLTDLAPTRVLKLSVSSDTV